MPWPCLQKKLFSLSLESTLPFQFIVLTVPSSQVWSDGPMFYSWLWINAEIRLYCSGMSWNVHSIETSSRRCFCIIISANRGIYLTPSFFMSEYSVNITTLFEMPTMSANSRTFSQRSFNNILWILFTISFHFIWSTTAVFVLAARTTSFKLYQTIFYCCKW